jgi:TolA-binding protein
MPLRSRSIPLVLFAILSASTGLAQPQVSTPESRVERLRTAYDEFAQGSFTRALRVFDEVADPHRLDSWDPQTQLTRVELLSYLRPRHNPDRDLAALVDAYAASPHAPYAHIRRGLAALQRSQHGQARLHFDEGVRTAAEADAEQVDDAAAGTAYYWLGIAHLIDPDGALREQGSAALRISADEYPRNPFADDALFALGQIYEERGELDSAITKYDRIVARYPGSDIRLEAAMRAAQSHLRLGRTESARTLLRNVRSELDHPWADAERQALQTAEYHLLNAAAEHQAGDFAAAERSYLTVVYSLESPYRRLAMLGLADTYDAAGHPDSAGAIYTRLVRERRSDDEGMIAEYHLAAMPLHPPYPAESLEPISRIAADSSHLMANEARVTLSSIQYLRQDFDAAEALLTGALASTGSQALRIRAAFLRGVVRLANARHRDADQDLALALRLARAIPAVLMPERDSILSPLTLAGAIAMIHAGRPSDAVPQLNRLMQTQPSNSAEAMYWLGEAYYASGALPAAALTMEDLIERYPGSERTEDALYAIGWAQLRQRKLDRAEAAFARLVKAYPLTSYATAAHLRRGDCLYLLRKYAAAADAYALVDSVQAHPDFVEYARYQGALALYHAEKRDSAGAAFRLFVDQYPQSELADDATFMRGLVDYTERRYRDAVNALEGLARDHAASPLIPRALTTMAGAYYALGQFDSSRARAERAVREFATSSYREEAEAAMLRADNAIRERDRQLARDDDRNDEMMQHARTLRESGDVIAAIAEYDRVRSRANDETAARAAVELARCHLIVADTARALDDLRWAAATPGTSGGRTATWELADHFRASGNADSAVAWYARAAALADSSAPLAYLRTGQSYLGSSRWSEALEAFNRVADRPGVADEIRGEAYLGIAAVHAGQGDRQRAREMFERLIRDHAGEEISRRAEEQLRALGNL